MKTYKVPVDYESDAFIVKAKNEEEARDKAYKQAMERRDKGCFPKFWSAEAEEVKDEI
jgi:hypothetical protein